MVSTIHGPLDTEPAPLYSRVSQPSRPDRISKAQASAAPKLGISRVITRGVDGTAGATRRCRQVQRHGDVMRFDLDSEDVLVGYAGERLLSAGAGLEDHRQPTRPGSPSSPSEQLGSQAGSIFAGRNSNRISTDTHPSPDHER